jgi:hypothetical protein
MHAGRLLSLFLLLAATHRSMGRGGIFGAAPPPSSPGGDGDDQKCSRTCESEYCTGTLGTYVVCACRRSTAICAAISLYLTHTRGYACLYQRLR